ncbi:phosphoglucomutase-2, partial [Brachionus plicatilis]
KMGAGYTMMNNLTIIQTAQGFLAYLKEKFGQELNKHGIIIGFDARYNSNTFAKLTANIFLRDNIPVYLFGQITPTPFVPYGILKYKCCAGVMVTASHNPKEDNGYKVYFNNGSQIIPPHDEKIAKSILDNLEPKEDSWDISLVDTHPLRIDPFDQVYKAYFDDLKQLSFNRANNSNTSLKITYTAMHGVGHEFSKESFKSFNLNPFIPVIEQIYPDPEFPTVKFPNPEEGKSSLNLAIKTANENESTLIIANDPDADRLAIAEKLPGGEWKIFNGNETASLLGWWLWHNYKATNPDENDFSNVYMLYSTVSSHILKSIAAVEGFSCEDTLTGFKWMGNRAHDLLS